MTTDIHIKRRPTTGGSAGSYQMEKTFMHHQSTQSHQPTPIISSDRAVSIKTVMERLSCGRTRLYAMIRNGEFPAPTKFGRQSRWSEKALDAWLRDRFSAH